MLEIAGGGKGLMEAIAEAQSSARPPPARSASREQRNMRGTARRAEESSQIIPGRTGGGIHRVAGQILR